MEIKLEYRKSSHNKIKTRRDKEVYTSMATTVKLLDHQARFVQAPYIYSEIRFFFLIGGYACG